MIPKTNSRSKVRKGPWESKAYRDAVKAEPCLICGIKHEAQEAHHIRECFPRTMGKRIGDEWVVPLCMKHHTELHKHSRSFWNTRLINPMLWARDFHQRWKNRNGRTPAK